MYYNIYKILSTNHDVLPEKLLKEPIRTELLEIVESGLSGGELRQSLLDRIREEIKNGNPIFLNENFRNNPTVSSEYLTNNPDKAFQVYDDILYELSDMSLVNTEWSFTNEKIVITKDD